MLEEWKFINGYESIYEVSSTGKIRSVDRTIKRKSGSMKEQLSARSKNHNGKNNPNWKGFCAIIDSNGNDVQLCETLKEAQNWIRQNTNWKNARLSHIGEVCQGKAKQAYGFRYEYRKNK